VTLVAAFLMAVAAIASPLAAQDRERHRRPPHPSRDETFRIAEAYLLSNLQDSLDLTDAEYNKVLPLVRQLQQARREQAEQRMERLRALRELLASGTATEAAVETALHAVQQVEAEGPGRVRKSMQALDAALTPVQQAKYRVFEADVESRIRRLLVRGPRHDDRARRSPPPSEPPQ
jgi:Spy/CpxP family protein refolding chaperone